MHIFTCKHSHNWLCIRNTFPSLLLFHTNFSLLSFVTISSYISSSSISSLFIFLIFSLKTPHPSWLLFLIVHLLFPLHSLEFPSFFLFRLFFCCLSFLVFFSISIIALLYSFNIPTRFNLYVFHSVPAKICTHINTFRLFRIFEFSYQSLFLLI